MEATMPMYQKSLVRNALKGALSVAERVLPQPVFSWTYPRAFALYQRAIRFAFLRHWASAVLTGNEAARERALRIHRVMPRSLVGWRGLVATHDAVLSVIQRGIPGAIVECGVARGGSAALMALVNTEQKGNRMVWLFDSYEGLPEPTEDDFLEGEGVTGTHVRPLPKGSCLGPYEEVEQFLFEDLQLDRSLIRMVKGWFQDTLPDAREQIGEISVLRLDGDWYESTKCCLDNLFDQVSPGGYVIIDDYGTCFGAKKAVDEFLATRKIEVELVFDGRGGCTFVKPAHV